jgi:hypothetical protein
LVPEADGASSILDAVQGWDISVRDTISKGRFVQGAQHPRIFGRGHIGRGHINPVVEIAEKMQPSLDGYVSIFWWLRKSEKMQPSLDGYVSIF